MKQKDTSTNSSSSNSSEKRSALSKYAYFSGIGFQMIAVIGIFAYLGYKIDAARESDTPIWTAFLSLAGVLISLYLVIRAVSRLK